MYRVLGYDALCIDFDVRFDSFVSMVQFIVEHCILSVFFIHRNGKQINTLDIELYATGARNKQLISFVIQ